ncbi:MAG: fibronectin type III domain-containing protein [Acidobacteria bacterium]|nr:MAG: fibronectin type III domain-containing protein [Acidobacteriota bacterium]
MPPSSRVSPPVKVAGFQRGSNLILSWQLPPGTSRTDVYRFVESSTASPGVTKEDFSARSILIASVLGDASYSDRLEFADQPVRVYYAVRFVNEFGQKSDFSEFLVIQPVPNVSLPPSLLSVDVSQDKLTVKWKEPNENVDGSSPPNVRGYNVYRVEKGSELKKLNSSPVSSDSFDDFFFEFGVSYKYFVRSVSLDKDGNFIESDDSNIFEVVPKDVFPPSRPEGLSVAASPGAISIFFAASPEKDVVGYFVFRSEDPNLPLLQWQKLNVEPSEITAFSDRNVQSGKTYYYFVRAVDKFGNLSEPSEVVAETLP